VKQLLLIFLLILNGIPLFSSLRLLPNPIFFNGEKLVYRVNMLGMQVGYQTIFFDGQTNQNGITLQVGRGSTISTPFFKGLYPIDDKEATFFSNDSFLPVYYERWVSEGKWRDHWHFYFKEGVHYQYRMNSQNNTLKTVPIKALVYNYVTLIQILRNIDANWYIAHKKSFYLNYLFGEKLIRTRFSVSKITIDIDWKKKTFFEMKEEEGLGLILRYATEDTRVPYQLVLPAYSVPGFKSINIVATLDSRNIEK